MHGTVTTYGPGMYGLIALGAAAGIAALLLMFDSLRRPPEAYARVPETRWPYAAVGLVYAIAYAAWWFNAVKTAAPWVGMVVLFGVPTVLFVGAAYLLRVVYPKPPATEDTTAPTGRTETDDSPEEPRG